MRKNVLLGYACSIFLLVSCAKTDISEIAPTSSPLEFSTFIGKRQTKASEFNNSSWSEGSKFTLRSYLQKENAWETFFSDNLIQSGGTFTLEGSQRFSVPYSTKFIAIYPDQDSFSDTGADFSTTYPQFSYTANGETDLLAAVQDHEPLEVNIQIPFYHLLSQINFGVYEYPGVKISISDIRIEGLNSVGTYHLMPVTQSPGYWELAIPSIQAYVYTFSNNNSFTTNGSSDTFGYIFGDGGVFAPDNGGTPFKYVFSNGTAYGKDDTSKPEAKLSNSLMLLPHNIEQLDANNATAYFKYSITDLNNNPIKTNSIQEGMIRLADLNIGWEPNYRYVYMLQFNMDNDALSFNVNVSSFEN